MWWSICHTYVSTDSVPQVPPIYHVSVRVGGVIHTYEEGFWGPITCQQLHGSWIEPEPESHSQHQQARELKRCSPNPHYEAHNCDHSLNHCSRFYNLIGGQERVTTLLAGTILSSTFLFIQLIKILCCSCLVLLLQWLLMLNACFKLLPEVVMRSLVEWIWVWNWNRSHETGCLLTHSRTIIRLSYEPLKMKKKKNQQSSNSKSHFVFQSLSVPASQGLGDVTHASIGCLFGSRAQNDSLLCSPFGWNHNSSALPPEIPWTKTLLCQASYTSTQVSSLI